MKTKAFFRLITLLILVLGMGAFVPVRGQITLTDYVLEPKEIAVELEIPWEMEWAGIEGIFFTELTGKIKRVDPATQAVSLLYEFTDVARENQTGLMGMALHPDFDNVPQVFAIYTYYNPNFDLLLRVVRLDYNAATDVLENATTLYENIPAGQSSTGARLVISPDQFLFISVGDLENGALAQDTNILNGKILRLAMDGSIPADNPFGNTPVWSMGHRNPQGMVFAPDGTLYSSEHGSFSDDELNIILKGRNYGWPLVAGKCNAGNQALCDQLNVVEPLEAWTPTVAPAGMAYYGLDTIAEWKNSLLIAGLKAAHINWVKLSNNGQEAVSNEFYLEEEVGRIRDILVTPEGRIFISTSNTDIFGTPGPEDDKIYELEHVLIDAVPTIKNDQEFQLWHHAPERKLEVRVPKDVLPLHLEVLDLQGRMQWESTITAPNQTLFLPQELNGFLLVQMQGKTGRWHRKILQ